MKEENIENYDLDSWTERKGERRYLDKKLRIFKKFKNFKFITKEIIIKQFKIKNGDKNGVFGRD